MNPDETWSEPIVYGEADDGLVWEGVESLAYHAFPSQLLVVFRNRYGRRWLRVFRVIMDIPP